MDVVEDLVDEVGIGHICNLAQLPAAERAEGDIGGAVWWSRRGKQVGAGLSSHTDEKRGQRAVATPFPT